MGNAQIPPLLTWLNADSCRFDRSSALFRLGSNSTLARWCCCSCCNAELSLKGNATLGLVVLLLPCCNKPPCCCSFSQYQLTGPAVSTLALTSSPFVSII